MATRSTQTNEVNRTAALLPALVHATPPGGPLRLVELGASAGLNLLVDRYAHRYLAVGEGGAGDGDAGKGDAGKGDAGDGAPDGGRAERSSRDPSPPSPVLCECVVEGTLPALRVPRIAERLGIDLDPIDVRDDKAARWLLACIWPDEPDRIARLRAAIELARRDPSRVVRGDALALLPELLAPADDGVHPVVWHSWVLAYWTPTAQRALAAAIDELGAARDLTWLYLEQPSETPGLPTPAVAGVRHDPDDSALVAVSYRGGERTVERLADAHPHVHRMRWLA